MSFDFPTSSTRSSRLTIGVRDSGVGGLTVARCIQEALPHARLLYFADTAHVPYGGRAPEEIKHFALHIAQFLIEHGAQIVVFACNTSSAIALQTARETLSVPIVGTIIPGAIAAVAATKNHRIGVLATQATVENGDYGRHIRALKPEVRVLEVACPDFVLLVESEQTESAEAHKAARRYLQQLLENNVDTIVLGCTHYPLLLPTLREVAAEMNATHLHWIDPAEAIAADVRRIVAEKHLNVEYSNGNAFSHDAALSQGAASAHNDDIFFASGEQDGVRRWVHRLLGIAHPQMKSAPVFDLEPQMSTDECRRTFDKTSSTRMQRSDPKP